MEIAADPVSGMTGGWWSGVDPTSTQSERAQRLALWVGRTGYVVYALLAYFAAKAALWGGDIADPRDALQALGARFAGSTLILLLFVGLLCFALWRLVQVVTDVDGHGRGVGGLTVRAALLVSAGLHVSLAATALRIFLHSRDVSDATAQEWAARALQHSHGDMVLLAAGVVVLVSAIAHGYKAVLRTYWKYLRRPPWGAVLTLVASVGLTARGLIFLAMGGFLIKAAHKADPHHAKGLGDALRWFGSLPHPESVLVAVATGLGAFAMYSILEGVLRTRRPRP